MRLQSTRLQLRSVATARPPSALGSMMQPSRSSGTPDPTVALGATSAPSDAHRHLLIFGGLGDAIDAGVASLNEYVAPALHRRRPRGVVRAVGSHGRQLPGSAMRCESDQPGATNMFRSAPRNRLRGESRRMPDGLAAD